MIAPAQCNLCGSHRYSVVYKTYQGDISTVTLDSYTITGLSQGPLRIVKCAQCGLRYAYPRLSDETLARVYEGMHDAEYVQEEAGRRASARKLLSTIQKLKKGGKILDVGCAVGFLLDEARAKQWEVHGVEASSWAVAHARTVLGLGSVVHGTLAGAAYPGNYFDAVVLQDVIEHLPDPMGTLREVRRILKPDGVVCVNTPDIDSLVSKLLRARWWGVKQAHLYYFNRRTLHAMLRATGFTPVVTKSHTRVFSLGYWAGKLAHYHSILYKVFQSSMAGGAFRHTLLAVPLGDQIDVYARKRRTLEDVVAQENVVRGHEPGQMRVVAVLPAYNAAGTLQKTVADISRKVVDEIILVDDASADDTVAIARRLGLKVFVHERNKGYGANQKTCYEKALQADADIVVMVHPDYQYDPTSIAELVAPIKAGRADAVFGSRMIKGGALEGGMPRWKHNANILLTALENVCFGTFLTEYHSGFRAYSARLLRSLPLAANSDNFVFDTEIIAQILLRGYTIEEIPIRTRYFEGASTIGFMACLVYGMGILKTIGKYMLHTRLGIRFSQFV